jgi:hypothetical protein
MLWHEDSFSLFLSGVFVDILQSPDSCCDETSDRNYDEYCEGHESSYGGYGLENGQSQALGADTCKPSLL